MPNIEFKTIRDYRLKSNSRGLYDFFRDNKRLKIVGDLAAGSSYYKYFPLATAVKCLENNTMAFVEPSRWNDAYESLYYEADYSLVAKDYASHPKVYATCVTNKRYDEPAWRIYSNDDNVCVQFEINRQQLRRQLLESIAPDDTVYEGTVQYTYKGIIDSIWKKVKTDPKAGPKDNVFYKLFIAGHLPFGIENYLNLLLLKRVDFTHEQESRFFIVRKEDLTAESKKAVEAPVENSTATKRETVLTRGEVLILKNIEWCKILKRVTINEPEGSFYYGILAECINKMIDNAITAPDENREKKELLKPVYYPVYGTKPPTITIDKP